MIVAPRLYGIPNCDTVKRARRFLEEHGRAADFHDFRRDGLDIERLQRWSRALGWEALLNRRGTTWRRLDAAAQARAEAEDGALALMQAQPSLIRRPVMEWPDGSVSVGFDAEDWAARLVTAAGRTPPAPPAGR